MQSHLRALESSDEVAELSRIHLRLEKLRRLELSYAEQRAEGILSKSAQQELTVRLNDERKELLLEQAKLADKLKAIEEVRQQIDSANHLIASLPDVLPELSRQEQEQLIIALISEIEVDGANNVSITLRLDPDALPRLGLPTRLSASSRPPESERSSDFPSVESGNSTSEAPVQTRHLMNAAHYTHNMGYMLR